MSCLGKVCTVQHRNRDCRGGKNATRLMDVESERDELKTEVKRLNDLLCPHRQSQCVDCIEPKKWRTIRDESRRGPLNAVECVMCITRIIYTGNEHDIPCHHCGASTVGAARMYDFQ